MGEGNPWDRHGLMGASIIRWSELVMMVSSEGSDGFLTDNHGQK